MNISDEVFEQALSKLLLPVNGTPDKGLDVDFLAKLKSGELRKITPEEMFPE